MPGPGGSSFLPSWLRSPGRGGKKQRGNSTNSTNTNGGGGSSKVMSAPAVAVNKRQGGDELHPSAGCVHMT